LSIAATVLAGAEAEDGVAAESRFPQEVESPAMPPAELIQAARMFARLLICWVGAVAPEGSDGPERVPVEGSTREFARVKAAERPEASMEVEPMAEAEVMKGARAATAATVVRSSTMMVVEVLSAPQRPRAVMRLRTALFVPPVRPGLPPVAAM
jgi:hypothetical protein